MSASERLQNIRNRTDFDVKTTVGLHAGIFSGAGKTGGAIASIVGAYSQLPWPVVAGSAAVAFAGTYDVDRLYKFLRETKRVNVVGMTRGTIETDGTQDYKFQTIEVTRAPDIVNPVNSILKSAHQVALNGRFPRRIKDRSRITSEAAVRIAQEPSGPNASINVYDITLTYQISVVDQSRNITITRTERGHSDPDPILVNIHSSNKKDRWESKENRTRGAHTTVNVLAGTLNAASNSDILASLTPQMAEWANRVSQERP